MNFHIPVFPFSLHIVQIAPCEKLTAPSPERTISIKLIKFGYVSLTVTCQRSPKFHTNVSYSEIMTQFLIFFPIFESFIYGYSQTTEP